jgi:hypothetical protein
VRTSLDCVYWVPTINSDTAYRAGEGNTVNMSSSGVLFKAERVMLPAGAWSFL